MKSLVESLFDKDLVQKDLPTFGSLYKVRCVLMCDDEYKSRGMSMATKEDDYQWLLNTVKLNVLKRDIKVPVKIDNDSKKIDAEYMTGWRADEKIRNVIGYLVSVLNNIPLDSNHTNVVCPIDPWVLSKKLDPYLKNMKGNEMHGTGGNYYFSLLDGFLSFRLYRKDKNFTIIFEKKK